MKAPFPADASGMSSEPLAFFLNSGEYSSFVLAAQPRDEVNLLASMQEDDLWDQDRVQLTGAAVFFSLGSDAFNQAIWVYLDAAGKGEPPDRVLNATLSSRGEQIYLESLGEMAFGEDCDQFFLPEGEYEVSLLSWRLEGACDNPDADPKLFLENVHHELRFHGSANFYPNERTIHRAGADEHTFDE